MNEQPMQPTPVKDLADQKISDADYKRFVPVFLKGAKNLIEANDPFYKMNQQMLRANMTFLPGGGIPRQLAGSLESRLIVDGIIRKKEDETYEVLNWEPKL
ncbi:MAG: hypothetical protein V1902_02365 [Candidatus Falkowbacteria bacterium]